MKHTAGIIYFLAGMFFLAAGLPYRVDAAAFKPGEKLKYRIFLSDYPAGEVILDIMPMTAVQAVPAYHFVMTARTSPVLDALFMLSDRVESYADAGMTRALLYKEHKSSVQHEATVTFDWKKHEAQYSLGGKKYRPTALVPGAFDPLSVLYALRGLDLRAGGSIAKPVTNGLQCQTARGRVLGRQKVRVANRNYDTFQVELLLAEFSDLFKGAAVKLWISADAKQVPVRIVCRFPLGEIVAELAAL